VPVQRTLTRSRESGFRVATAIQYRAARSDERCPSCETVCQQIRAGVNGKDPVTYRIGARQFAGTVPDPKHRQGQRRDPNA